jgi:hypothetical protein
MAKELVLKLGRRPSAVGIEGQAETAGRDRLLREGRLLAQCDHPSLVRVVDLDSHEGHPFLVMEHVTGLTLEQFIEHNRPGPDQAARLVAELARAVAYLHARGIIHQDIKPRNVLVDDQGRPRLIDFGLARLRHAWSEDTTRWTGGTAAYMSPEQALSCADRIGPRTDIFGLGGLLYHLLTGQPLYQGASRTSRLRQAKAAAYVPVRQVNRRVPRALQSICHKALAADPERRYRTAVELERALQRFRARRWIRMAGLAMLATVALAVAVALALGLAAARQQPTGPPPKILAFVLEQFRGPEPLGPIGWSTQPILVDDEVLVSARLDAPAYSYLVALGPDGKDTVCHPMKDSEPPPRSTEIRLEGMSYGLTGEPGLQAFVLMVSRRPLPPYQQWTAREGIRHRWKSIATDRVWLSDGRDFTPVSSIARGELRERSGSRPPAPFQEVCEYLAKRPEVEAIQAIAFPVRPKG